jgi:hypothetical protein
LVFCTKKNLATLLNTPHPSSICKWTFWMTFTYTTISKNTYSTTYFYDRELKITTNSQVRFST